MTGGGAERLAPAGIEVTRRLPRRRDARALNRAFFTAVARRPPARHRSSAAMTLDGKIAAADGASRWITGEAARPEAHRLRSRERRDAWSASAPRSPTIPRSTCALEPPWPREPYRVVVDSRARLPARARGCIAAGTAGARRWSPSARTRAARPGGGPGRARRHRAAVQERAGAGRRRRPRARASSPSTSPRCCVEGGGDARRRLRRRRPRGPRRRASSPRAPRRRRGAHAGRRRRRCRSPRAAAARPTLDAPGRSGADWRPRGRRGRDDGAADRSGA